MNIFEKRAQQIQSEKFSNSINAEEVVSSSQDVMQNQTNQPNNIEDITADNKKEEGNIFEIHAKKNNIKNQEKFGFLDTIRDIGEQIVSKGLSGISGAYGNILDSFGIQIPKGTDVATQQNELYEIKGSILDKMNRGELPTFSELMLLSDDDIPSPTRIPSSKDIQSDIEKTTGIGEGKTPYGRIAGRGSEFLGEGVALGGSGKALSILGAAGGLGQTTREFGLPESIATGVEIALPLTGGAITKKLAPSSKEAKDITKAGRKIGLSDQQITPLIQSEGKSAIVSKVARKGTKTKKLFNSIKESLGESYNSLKSLPEASNKIPNAEQINLRKSFGDIRNELSKTLAPSPEKEAAINYIEKSLETLRNTNVSPEYLINFWQDINKSVKWNSITGGKKALTKLKEPILTTLKKVSPEIAEDFELTNKLYSKYAQISKKLKPDLVDSFVNKGEILAALPAGLSLASGNPLPLMGLGGEVATRLLAREMLINPYFQNIAKKLVTNINAGSVKGVTSSVEQVKEYMQRKYPENKWDFLTEKVEED